ncbi:MAG: hypothetical protein ABEI78_01990 [Candidatus Nanohaloarchaea archaeon]
MSEAELFNTKLDRHLNSDYRNIVDYLLVSEDIETATWDENPVKTAVCYRVLSQLGELRNQSKTEEWMKNWISNLENFDLDKKGYRMNLREYIEGAAEISITLDDLDSSSIKEFFTQVMIEDGPNAGSWEGEPYLTAKVVKAFEHQNIEPPKESIKWIENINESDLSIRELSSILYYLNGTINAEKFNAELQRSIKDENLTFKDKIYLLKVDSVSDKEKYISDIKEEMNEITSIHINAGLTKALWQASTLKAASFSGEEIKDKLAELNDRYWVKYIEDVSDESKIVLDLSEEAETFAEKRDILLLARGIETLDNIESLYSIEVPEKYFEELKAADEDLNRENIIGNHIVAERATTTFLGLLSGVLLYVSLQRISLPKIEFLGFDLINLSLFGMIALLTFTGYEGGIKPGFQKSKNLLQEFTGLKTS